jgi:predicted NUDIX family NTP pyrophosphohydrolase
MKKSAGILLYRQKQQQLQVMLVHPGGPFWKNKDTGAWSIPKGEFTDEDPLAAAKREFKEETGFDCDGDFTRLEPLKQKSGKMVFAWALQQDMDVSQFSSNSFSLQWPPGSGKFMEVPEVDKAGWFGLEEARQKIIAGQVGFLEQLEDLMK